MHICAKCGSNRVHRTPPATLLQRVRRQLTHKSMFRSATSGHIGWKRERHQHHHAEQIETYQEAVGPPPDLQAIDEALGRSAQQKR